LSLNLAQALQRSIRGNPRRAKTGSFRPGQRQRTRGERLKTDDSNKFTKTLAQLLIDAKTRGLHWLRGLGRTGFISKKTMG
jgi:hypothetical protein